MAQSGRSPIPKSVEFDVAWPDDLKDKAVNLLWKSDAGQIAEVGFRAAPDGELVEEWFAVGDLTPAVAVTELVHPRAREVLAGKQADVKPPQAGPPRGVDYLPPSVEEVEVPRARARK